MRPLFHLLDRLLEISINSRFYFDYNATSPLAESVKSFLASGDFLFGNPSSLHAEGKKSQKKIREITAFLLKNFGFHPTAYKVIYHSGATEGINAYFKGNAFHLFKANKKAAFYFSAVDHTVLFSLEDYLKNLGHEVVYFSVNHDGQFCVPDLIAKMQEKGQKGYQLFLNFTYVNNESGVVWPLAIAETIKKATGASVHVDAVQLVGKIDHWQELSAYLDAYTFSGHKFGALKGIGFSFIKNNSAYFPLITGGGQQDDQRAGTENLLGIISLQLALQEVIEKFVPGHLGKQLIENELKKELAEWVTIVGELALSRNNTTLFLVHKKLKSQEMLMKFDLNGMDVSIGSACSSGIVKENRVLLAMGFSPQAALSSLRLSFSPFLSEAEAIQYSKKIIALLK